MRTTKKTVIAIDIDEVLSCLLSAIVAWHNNIYKTSLKLEDFFTYDYWNVWGGTQEEAISKVEKFARSGGYKGLDKVNGSIEAVKTLSQKYDLFLVTSRRNMFKADTLSWVNKNFPDIFGGIYFGNHYSNGGKGISKSELCQAISADVFIDDLPHYALECSRSGMRSFLFGDYPWNKGTHAGIERAEGWDDIVRKLM